MKKEICYSDLALLTQPIEANIELLLEHGADKIELLMDGLQWDAMDDQIARMSKVLPQYNAGYTVHPPAWDTSLTSENKAIREASFSEYAKAIQFAHNIGAEHVVIHPGFCFSPVFDKEIAQMRAADAIHRLCKIAAPLGVKLAVENVGYKGASIFSEAEFAAFLDGMDSVAGYLLDTGHAYLNDWDIPALIRSISHRLLAVHLHDNYATGDDHLPIGEGGISWEPVFATLAQTAPDCQLILEYAPGTELVKLQQGKSVLLERLQLV
ncbi:MULTISPECIES: sugar phosphate isomerase/epimerase family protein [Brevibacillus]|uniref:Xylose isomerase n=1 Tax=Brevibacillus parabrevis TaxID=54914 RepID=A0A4Y3PIZ9_BREPA|nr:MULTISPECIES: sugar phosphate isomerase/epimerase family protein [Brevibacillus]MDH6351602.1 sugar phosphate isomerase/epimerase [Brevibacillus sp. 1238]MDR4997472.1 sugar phosphate isomerase/epimerase family protein [Brevibacillus parabrevis]MED2255770.1 sugar phosphate isomerase/epimerase [Brevibacillus parabrevis]NRQ55146.1 sugar phosphate isomerase/epimerase [Brevibacillus sp. HD1.4A]RNB97475.1 sugar phosphate isomerase/epimerase [Brevibacillus parabrevis]